MAHDKLERVLRTVDPGKRALLKKLVVGAGFAVPMIASYSAKDLAFAAPVCTSTEFGQVTRTVTLVGTTTTTTTTTATVTTTSTLD